MNDSSISSLLADLGLTEYEAKTLSTLFRLKETEAPEISRIAQVPKTRVYDVLDRLTKKGLVIEIYGRPKKYRVIEPGDALDELIKLKKEELKELEDKSKKIKEKVGKVERQEDEVGEKVMKVKDKQDFLKILAQEIESAKSELIAFAKLDENEAMLKEALRSALERKVKMKLVNESSSNAGKTARKYVEKGASVKSASHGMNAFIIDNRKVILGLSDFTKEMPEYHFTIWNNNKPMINALQKYFEHCWQQGKEV